MIRYDRDLDDTSLLLSPVSCVYVCVCTLCFVLCVCSQIFGGNILVHYPPSLWGLGFRSIKEWNNGILGYTSEKRVISLDYLHGREGTPRRKSLQDFGVRFSAPDASRSKKLDLDSKPCACDCELLHSHYQSFQLHLPTAGNVLQFYCTSVLLLRCSTVIHFYSSFNSRTCNLRYCHSLSAESCQSSEP